MLDLLLLPLELYVRRLIQEQFAVRRYTVDCRRFKNSRAG